MLSVQHLRIGNLIKSNNAIFQILEVHNDNVFVQELGNTNNKGTFSEEEISGIPLSENLLNDAGWTKIKSATQNDYQFTNQLPLGSPQGFLDLEFPYNNNNDSARVWLHYDTKTQNGHAIYFSHFHALQNIVHSITGIDIKGL